MARARAPDLTEHRFGRWTVIDRAGRSDGGVAMWNCRCACGVTRAVASVALRNGASASCGCWAREVNRAPDGVSGLISLRTRYRHSAKNKGLLFELTLDEFQKLTSSPCHYCGALPGRKITFNKKPYTTYTFNGIDRKDNTLGYVLDNCLPCCIDCNSCKGARAYTEFLTLVVTEANGQFSWSGPCDEINGQQIFVSLGVGACLMQTGRFVGKDTESSLLLAVDSAMLNTQGQCQPCPIR